MPILLKPQPRPDEVLSRGRNAIKPFARVDLYILRVSLERIYVNEENQIRKTRGTLCCILRIHIQLKAVARRWT